jgi:hypothetical protein
MENIAKSVIFSECCLPDTQQSVERDKRVNLRQGFPYVAFVPLNHAPSDK